jgi:lipoprotein-anchoring transpeptidase ErfK/SrfK
MAVNAARMIWSLVVASAATVAAAVTQVGAEAPAPPPVPAPISAVAAAAPAAPAPQPAAHQPLIVRHILPIAGPMKLGEWHWNEEGAPATGRVVVTADLQAGTLSVFRDGWEIGTAAIIYGRDDKPTPLGAFPILQKKADNYSRTYGNAPMPFTLRLTDDGIAIHGSGGVAAGYATHGCLGVPVPFAKKLFAATQVGDLVLVTRGRMLDKGSAITHG